MPITVTATRIQKIQKATIIVELEGERDIEDLNQALDRSISQMQNSMLYAGDEFLLDILCSIKGKIK